MAATVSVSGGSSSESALIFMGTGCSSAIPYPRCLISPSHPPCHVCFQSLSLPPNRNPNYRCNASLLIDYCESDGNHSYILIDAGKTFRETVLRWFLHHHIPRIDSIVLTHEHADAVLGLDDVRSIQPVSPTNDIDPTPVYLTQHSMTSLETKLPYLVKKKLKEGQEIRRVAQFSWNIIAEDCNQPFFASGLKLTPLPVMHGEDYICLGFLFGDKSKVAYLSDVSRIPATTDYVISKSGAGRLDLLILDSLYKTLETVKMLCPKQALLIGMNHEFDHHQDNELLMEWSRREGILVQLAHDGLRVPINL
nr:putative hydrolase C777.06c isoform X2 [Arachis hypogaea]